MCRKWHKIRDPCDYKKACNILQTPNTKLQGKLEVWWEEECLQSIEVDNFLEWKLEEVSSKEECLQYEVEEKDKNESQIERILKQESEIILMVFECDWPKNSQKMFARKFFVWTLAYLMILLI